MSKETGTEQKREDVCPLQVNKNLIKVCNNMFSLFYLNKTSIELNYNKSQS